MPLQIQHHIIKPLHVANGRQKENNRKEKYNFLKYSNANEITDLEYLRFDCWVVLAV